MAFVTHISFQTGANTSFSKQTCLKHCQRKDFATSISRNCTVCKAQDAQQNTQESEENSGVAAALPVPTSFEAACEQARQSLGAALAAGSRRIFIELDTKNGDETFTSLKTTLPTVRAILEFFNTSTVQVTFPDAGAAALAKRDWGPDVCKNHSLVGVEQYQKRDTDAATIIVVPRASEVDSLVDIVSNAGDDVVIIVNPDLVDMGVTGLSLNARRLRTNVIDRFSSAYFLRTYGWGVLQFAFPGNWAVWVDDPNEESGFRCVATLQGRPTADQIDEILDTGSSNDPQAQGNPLESAFKGVRRFLNAYMKG